MGMLQKVSELFAPNKQDEECVIYTEEMCANLLKVLKQV